jgi:hypothetical protein
MIVTAQNKTQQTFPFIQALIEELLRWPTKDNIWFPMPSRSAVYAEIEYSTDINNDDKPEGEFFIVNRRHGMQMAHSAVVTTVVQNGALMYQLQIKPNSRLRRNKHRSVTTTHPNPKALALALVRNYSPGSNGRKVVSIIEAEKEAA